MANKNYVVAQGYDLIEAHYRDSLTNQEMKIALTLISMVQPKDKEFNSYEFTVTELAEMLGLKKDSRNLYRDIRKVARGLRTKQIVIESDGYRLETSWMSSAEYFNDGRIKFSFDPKLKPYLLDLKNHFSTYRLGNVLSLEGAYSIRLYELMKKWQNIVVWDVPVDELRKMLGANQKSYENFGSFKQKVLTPAVKEINESTDVIVEVTEKRKGRRITDLSFKIKARPVVVVQDDVVKSTDQIYKDSILNELSNMARFQITDRFFNEIYGMANQIYKPYHVKKELLELVKMANEPYIKSPVAAMRAKLNEQKELFVKGMKPTLQPVSNEVQVDWFIMENELEDIRSWKPDATAEEVNAIYEKYNPPVVEESTEVESEAKTIADEIAIKKMTELMDKYNQDKDEDMK